jgi:hypothetical protein
MVGRGVSAHDVTQPVAEQFGLSAGQTTAHALQCDGVLMAVSHPSSGSVEQ